MSYTKGNWIEVKTTKNSGANTHLISASPYLLEACKEALSLFESCEDDLRLSHEAKLLEQAIQKAEGKL
jgi:hypothetical protein